MDEKELIISSSPFKNGLFASRPVATAGRCYLLRSSVTGNVIEVNEKTTSKDIFLGKFDEKIEVDIKTREIEIIIPLESANSNGSFLISLSVDLEIISPVYCYSMTLKEIKDAILKVVTRNIRNVSANYSVFDCAELEKSLKDLLTRESTVNEISGFKYSLVNVKCGLDKDAQKIFEQVKKIQDGLYKVQFSVPSKDQDFSFIFTADAKIKIVDFKLFSLIEPIELQNMIQRQIQPKIRKITSTYSILDIKGMIERIVESVETDFNDINYICYSLFNVNCQPDDLTKAYISKVIEMENRVYSISMTCESKDNTYFFTITAKAKINVADPSKFNFKNEDSIIELISPLISSSISRVAREFSVVQYEKMNDDLNKLLKENEFNGNSNGFMYKIINVECRLTDSSKEYASRITGAQLDKRATIKEIEAKAEVRKIMKGIAKDPISDMFTAIQMDVIRGNISEEEALKKTKEYMQSAFEQNHSNFKNVINTIIELRDSDLLTPSVADSWLEYANSLYQNLLSASVSNQVNSSIENDAQPRLPKKPDIPFLPPSEHELDELIEKESSDAEGAYHE